MINLGADIIIQRNIAELYEVQLSDDEFIAGAPDLGYHGRLAIDISPKELGKKDPFTYVNADVLLLNLHAIRQSFYAGSNYAYLAKETIEVRRTGCYEHCV